jgi:hypothetical protein
MAVIRYLARHNSRRERVRLASLARTAVEGVKICLLFVGREGKQRPPTAISAGHRCNARYLVAIGISFVTGFAIGFAIVFLRFVAFAVFVVSIPVPEILLFVFFVGVTIFAAFAAYLAFGMGVGIGMGIAIAIAIGLAIGFAITAAAGCAAAAAYYVYAIIVVGIVLGQWDVEAEHACVLVDGEGALQA